MDQDDEMNLDDNSNLFENNNEDDDGAIRSENEIKCLRDVILVHIEKTQKKITELIPDYDIGSCINSNNDIVLGDLISALKKTGFPIDQNMIYYWCPDAEMFVYCGSDPLPDDITIPSEDYLNFNELKIKCKENPISLIHQIMSEEANEMNLKQRDGNLQEKKEAKNNCRRTKERKIGYIIEKVVQWRNYYNGVPDAVGKVSRLSLEEAANKVAISKKSLDDYLLQVRFGRKYGFNFNDHKNDKVGILRAFVKRHKSKSTTEKPKKKKEKKSDQIQSKKEEEEKF